MPELPDLRGKVRIDTHELPVAEAEVKGFGETVKRTFDSNSGAGSALLRFGKDGELAFSKISSSTVKNRSDLDALSQRAKTFGEGLDTDMRKGLTAVVSLGEDGSAALRTVSQAMTPVADAAATAASSTTSLGARLAALGGAAPPVIGVLIGAALAISSLLAPTIALAVGLTAALAVMASAAAITAAFGAGVFLLSKRTDEGALAIQLLGARLGSMADELAGTVLPLLPPLIDLMDRVASRVARVAEEAVAGFQTRFPVAIQIADSFLAIIFDHLEALGPVVARFFDGFVARAPGLEAVFSSLLDVGVGAVDGLLANLLRLTDWFESRLPTFGPVTQATFDGIGGTVQGLGSALGALADIMAQVVQAAGLIISAMRQQLQPALDELARHPEVARAALAALAAVMFVLVAALASPAVIIASFAALLLNLIAVVLGAWDAISQLMGGIRDFAASAATASAAAGGFLAGVHAMTDSLPALARGTSDASGAAKILLGFLAANAAALGIVGAAFGFLGDHLHGSTAAADATAASQHRLSAAIDGVTRSLHAQNDEIQKNLDIANADIAAGLAYQSAQLAVRSAVDQVTAASLAATQATAGYGAKSTQAQQANLALQQAIEGAQQAMIQDSLAAVDLTRKHDALAGITLSARDAVNLQIAELQKLEATLGPDSPVRAAIDGYIAELNRIPRDVTTNVTTIVSRQGANAPGFRDPAAGLAAGGPALPNSIYTVGERGPETLVMGATGGYVIPHASAAEQSAATDTSVIERLLSQIAASNAAIARALTAGPAPFATRAYGP